jgi:hypothetical protein
VHDASIATTPFEYVTETVRLEVYLVNEPPITTVIIENFPLATGGFFLGVVYLNDEGVINAKQFSTCRHPAQDRY